MESIHMVIQSDLFGMVKWPFQWLSDLQLGDQTVTLNHLGKVFFFRGSLYKTRIFLHVPRFSVVL